MSQSIYSEDGPLADSASSSAIMERLAQLDALIRKQRKAVKRLTSNDKSQKKARKKKRASWGKAVAETIPALINLAAAAIKRP